MSYLCKEDDESKHRAAGIQGTIKDAVDTQHNAKLTERCKDMANKTDNDLLLAKLETGGLSSNELFYQLDYHSSMSGNCQLIIEGNIATRYKNIGLKLHVLNPPSPLLSKKKKSSRVYLL